MADDKSPLAGLLGLFNGDPTCGYVQQEFDPNLILAKVAQASLNTSGPRGEMPA